jgi:hypothetical protein
MIQEFTKNQMKLLKKTCQTSLFFFNEKKDVFLHFLFFSLALFICRKIFYPDLIYNSNLFIKWDAGWYESIKNNGYIYNHNAQNNTGFYPFFPYLWRLTNLSAFGISIFNFFVFCTSFFILDHTFKFNRMERLLMLSIPSVLFFFVPYSESLFFLFSVFIISGVKNNNFWLTSFGFFLCCLIRPTYIIFIPILSILFLITNKNENKKKYLYWIIFCLLSFGIVTVFQWIKTGIWFAHSTSQIKHWNHSFHFTHFPITSWGGPKILWLDASALWIGLISTFYCIKFILFKPTIVNKNKDEIISYSYLCIVTMIVLLMNGYNDKGQSTILSLNRYFFSSAFFFVFLHYFLTEKKIKIVHVILLTSSLLFIWFFFGAYGTIDYYSKIKTILYFTALTIWLIGFIIVTKNSWFLQKKIWLLFYLLNTFLQAWLFCRFLSGTWVG